MSSLRSGGEENQVNAPPVGAGGGPQPASPAANGGPPVVAASAPPVAARSAVVAATPQDAAAVAARPTLKDELARILIHDGPPWLASAVFHLVLLIILALSMIVIQRAQQIDLRVDGSYADEIGNQLEFDSPMGKLDTNQVEEPITPQNMKLVDDPFAAPAALDINPLGSLATSNLTAPAIGQALKGRNTGTKQALLGKFGGTALTEAAVSKGLKWLAKNQKSDGSWSLRGPYGQGSFDEAAESATAMALLAFQGAGNTDKLGEYKDQVSRGWKWLLRAQDGDGCFFRSGPWSFRFYTHAQCTIALCELYGMTKNPQLKKAAEKAVDYCVQTQSALGGWRYAPSTEEVPDVSVTGWVLMGLQSARMGGLTVPDEVFKRVDFFLNEIAQEGGSRYPYMNGEPPTPTMTAEALLCRQYLGWSQKDERLRDGAKWLTRNENLVNYRNRNVYYWYYATQVCHHMEGEYWKKWNDSMRQVIPENQVKSGPEAGSWHPLLPTSDAYGQRAGRLFVTCLSLYMLEVYYRHLPLYSKVALPGE